MPFKSERFKKYTSCRFVCGGNVFQIDIGNKFEGKHLNYLLVSHTHEDHTGFFGTQPKNTRVIIPSLTFLPALEKKMASFKFQLVKGVVKISGLAIAPFPVFHSSTSLTYGFRFTNPDKKEWVWLTDYMVVPLLQKRIANADILFLGASTMKVVIQHKGKYHGQAPVYNILQKISKMKNPPKRIILIHMGMGMQPAEVKVGYLQKVFPNLKIEYGIDGQTITI